MTLLQGGAPKCGNFWLYQILQQILTRSGHSTTSFIEQQPIYQLARHWDLNFPDQARLDVLDITDLQYSYRISSIYRMPVDDIATYVKASPHVWTHSPVCKKSGELFSLFDKKVYIIRDPRDRAISAAKYYCSAYMQKYYPRPEKDPQQYLTNHFGELMHEWLWHVFDHLRLSPEHNIHICFYEGFLFDFQAELCRLLHYLELDLPEHQRLELEQQMSFDSLKATNPKHLRKGQAGYWMQHLTEEQAELAAQMAGPLLRHLHYPLHKGDPLLTPANPPKTDYALLKEEILLAQALLYQV